MLFSRTPAVGTNISLSMAADGESSGQDMWLFLRVSVFCRMATLNLSRELSAKGSALNIRRPMSSGMFFRRIIHTIRSLLLLKSLVSLDAAWVLDNDSMPALVKFWAQLTFFTFFQPMARPR